MLSMSRTWPWARGKAGMEDSSLRVAAPALPTSHSFSSTSAEVSSPCHSSEAAFHSFFPSICSALKERKYLHCGCLQCHICVWVRSKLLNTSPSFPFPLVRGHMEQALCQGAEAMKHLLVSHPDEHWWPAASTDPPWADCALGPVLWEQWLPSAASWLPLLATGPSLFAIKASDK